MCICSNIVLGASLISLQMNIEKLGNLLIWNFDFTNHVCYPLPNTKWLRTTTYTHAHSHFGPLIWQPQTKLLILKIPSLTATSDSKVKLSVKSDYNNDLFIIPVFKFLYKTIEISQYEFRPFHKHNQLKSWFWNETVETDCLFLSCSILVFG